MISGPAIRLSPHLRIFDTGGGIEASTLEGAAAWASVVRVDLADLAPALRLWSRSGNMATARKRIVAAGDPRPTLNFLGSGDFHHLAALLIERVDEPCTVLHFDNHPDWVRLAPRWHCGSWVNRVLALPNVRRVVTVGPCSDDLANPGRKGGNWRALDAGKLVLFPWQHEPSRLRRPIADGPGHTWREGQIHWRNLAERSLDDAVALVLAAIPTDAVWITIDKDVLPEAEALTNWDQGRMPLAALEAMLRATAACKRILGADVCGDYVSARHGNLLKRIEAHLDQPARVPADGQGMAGNVRINRILAHALFDPLPGTT